MKIKAESYDNIVLEEVFNPISLISRDVFLNLRITSGDKQSF